MAETREALNDKYGLVNKDTMSFIQQDEGRDQWDKVYGCPPYEYEVYVLTDPTKPGNYNFDSLHFTHEPFYVGYGKKGKRAYESRKLGRQLDKYSHKVKRIKEIYEGGSIPRITIIGTYYTETKAKLMEKKLMNTIPRQYLTNSVTHLCEVPIKEEDFSNICDGILTM